MALTQEQQEVFDAVIASLRTNSRTIEQMTPQTSLGSADWFELNGGRKVSYDVLKTLIASLTSSEIDSLKIALKKTDGSMNLLFDNLDKDFLRGIEVAECEAGVKLVLRQYDPVDDGETEKEVEVPLAGAAQVAALAQQTNKNTSRIQKLTTDKANAPVEVESEEALAAMIAAGEVTEGQIYFIAEEE